jgi:glycosyltransferase involved in cell wall biosynthesis
MNIALISPYHGGSHKAWAAGYQRYSNHDVRLWTLPARFWKWRMHGGAVTLARRFLENGRSPSPHLILATDMLDLTTFLALTRPDTANVPAVLYMHENQLTYPLPGSGETGPMRRQLGERDYHYVFINFSSMLAADAVLFNSRYHLESWFAALPRYLKHFPEFNEMNAIDALRRKCSVLPVGIDLARFDPPPRQQPAAPPLILWNQRWEYDKNPDDFFAALAEVKGAGVPFRLALCGEQFGKRPSAFARAIPQFGRQLIHTGFADAETYRRLLWQADLVVSTAHHEFFGISILEAIYCRTLPLLPNRLSYPELIPPAHHAVCLYQSQSDLVEKLKQALNHPGRLSNTTRELAAAVSHFAWPRIAPQYDAFLKKLL